jgi:hypothetical protein
VGNNGVVVAINTRFAGAFKDPRSTRAYYALSVAQMKGEVEKFIPTLKWEEKP